MEKKPKQVEFDSCATLVVFETATDSVQCTKTHYQGDTIVSTDTLNISLKTTPFQTAMSIACEYVRNVALVEYE